MIVTDPLVYAAVLTMGLMGLTMLILDAAIQISSWYEKKKNARASA